MPRGIYCIETVWFEDQDQTSVRPILQFLRDFHLQVPFIHRTALTRRELEFNLERWLEIEPAEDYPILYLSFHGAAGLLELQDGSNMSFGRIRQCLAGACENRVAHFASCGTLDITAQRVRNFLYVTNARAVSGYTEENVDWVQSMAFDLVYLERMQIDEQQYLTSDFMQDRSNELMNSSPYSQLREHLGFELNVADQLVMTA